MANYPRDNSAILGLQSEQPDKHCTKYQAALEALKAAQDKYRQATPQEIITLLAPCLMLCAPSGMQEAERTAWYKAAIMTISDVPLQILRRACEQARRTCDHPAKIVPFICNFEPEAVRWSKEALRHAQAQVDNFNAPRIAKQEPDYITADELAELKNELLQSLNTNKGMN
jgi:hypothetical protein